jgi:hypothetical protein
MSMSPEDFIKVLTDQGGEEQAFRLGTIPSDYVSGRPRVTFDGESAASSRMYPYMSQYVPMAEDRVLVALVGHGAVILGKIV